MLITILYFKQYSDYLLSTNDDFEVTWGMAERIILLGYESATQKMVVEIKFYFFSPSIFKYELQKCTMASVSYNARDSLICF